MELVRQVVREGLRRDVKVLFCHNFYRQPGGEDQVYQDECWLLEHYGHDVLRFERSNHSISQTGTLALAAMTMWNRQVYREIHDLVRREQPSIVHFHNTFPLISPSAFYAAHRAGAAVVQTMHNFRTICPGSTLLREQAICEKCIARTFAVPSVVHGCYHGSRMQSGLTAALNAWQRIRRTADRCVNRTITLTEHSRNLFIKSGMAATKIAVKPNFVRPDPGVSTTARSGAVFVGRLSGEKGIATLLNAWDHLDTPIPLKILGDGPMRDQVKQAARQNPNISWSGQVPIERVLSELGQARVLICPSIWYETFGRTMIEAFATGTPVIASDVGSMKEIVTHGKNGFHFQVGDSSDLATKVKQCFADPCWQQDASRLARAEYETRYSAETNYDTILAIYRQAIRDRSPERGEPSA